MTIYKIYKESIRTNKHIHEISESQMMDEISEYTNQGEIIKKAKSEYGYDLGDATLYIRRDGFTYNNAEIVLTTKNFRPVYSVYIDGEYKTDRYDCEEWATINEALEVADMYTKKDGMYGIRDREAGNVIETNLTKEEAEAMLIQFEGKDKEDGTYEDNFYEIFFDYDINKLKDKYNMKISQLSERFGIPYRTVQNWCNGTRECPEYIVKMMDEILSKE